MALLILHWYLITLLLLLCHTYYGHSVLSSVNAGCANTLLARYITVFINILRHIYTLLVYPYLILYGILLYLQHYSSILLGSAPIFN